MSFFRNQFDYTPEKREVILFAGKPRRVLLEKRNYLFSKIQPIVHLKPIAETVIRTFITLNVYFAAAEEVLKSIEYQPIRRSQFQTEARFDFCPTPFGPIQMNGKTTFSVNQSNHIVGSRQSAFGFPLQARA